MKINKQQLISVLLVLLFICFLLTSCSVRKKAETSERQEEGRTEQKTLAKDSSIIDYFTDTTKIDATEVYFEKVEYYQPDSSVTGGSEPAVKSVTRATIKKQKKQAGETKAAATIVKVRTDSLAKDTASVVKQATRKETKKAFSWWWLLLLLAAIILYICYKKLRR